MAAGALLLDVRTPEELAAGHLVDAVNIPVQELKARLGGLGATRQAVVHCRSGARSAAAREILAQVGHDVLDIGAMASW